VVVKNVFPHWEGEDREKVFELGIPRTLEETCDPRRMTLLVYDMQVGIENRLSNAPEITARVAERGA
jgi:hypothetical protein